MQNNIIQEIKNRLNIVDIVGKYVQLKRNGARLVAPCPFHQETKPSFSVNEEQGLFYCFGCHASGDLFDFYCKINGLDFKEGLEQLAQEAGVKIQYSKSSKNSQKDDTRTKRQQMLKMYAFASNFFTNSLYEKNSEEALDYIKKRGLSKEIVEQFGLGWAKREWHNLDQALQNAGFDINLAASSGLLGKNDKGHIYDMFRGRLIFPIKNLTNQIIAFGGRIINNEDTAKYINSPDTPLYKKGEHLYGLAQARKGISVKSSVILTEGYMDVLTLHQFGFDNAVGVLGTALTNEQIKRLSGFTTNFILLFDGDRAGRKAALRACEMLLTKGLACKVVILPDGEDIDSLLRNQGIDTFIELQNSSSEGLNFCIDVFRSLAPKETVEWARNFLKQITIPELITTYASKLATHLQISEASLRDTISKNHKEKNALPNGKQSSYDSYYQNMRDKQILMYAVRYPNRLEDLRMLGADIILQTPSARLFWDKIETYGENCTYELNEQEKTFWTKNRGNEAPPIDNGDNELKFLREDLDKYYDNTQKASVNAALRDNNPKRDFQSDLKYLNLLQETLEKRHEQS